ncbi:PIN domain-containing protein [Leifsonia sp. NPDC056665]|uniref:PIN domain-containing protein n=1 Tax=Leifsonia sp. NPDC056665 TaxID=3345901 RepID=UPI0036A51627
MRALLDTNVVITGGYIVPEGITDVAICSISYAELEQGLVAPGLDPSVLADRKLQVLEIRQAFGRGLPFDDVAAMYYGRIVEAVHAAGRSPRGRIADLMIAAVARAHGAAIVTHNVADFAGLERIVRVIPAD